MRGASEKRGTCPGLCQEWRRARECVDKRVTERHRWTSDGRGTEAGRAERV